MKEKVALVLSGGGARGIAHIGTIEVLQENGYEITSVAGTSMGALIGGVFAQGKLDEFKAWITGLDQVEVLKLVDFTLKPNGLIKGEKVLSRIQEFIPDTNIEDLPIPYSACAVDIVNHKEVVFRSGSLYDAIRASIAIPTVFTPVRKNGGILVDGGVMNNVPISNVQRTDGDKLVVVYVNANIPLQKPVQTKAEEQEQQSGYRKWLKGFNNYLHINHPKDKKENLGFISIIDNTLTTAMLKQAQLSIEQGKPDILINISRASCGTYDFYKAKELVEIGRIAAGKELQKLRAGQAQIPNDNPSISNV